MRHSAASLSINLRSGPSPLDVASISRTISSSTSFSLNILTALIGSPTYFGFENLTVLTKPLSLISRHGMILGRSMLTDPQNSLVTECRCDGFFLVGIAPRIYFPYSQHM